MGYAPNSIGEVSRARPAVVLADHVGDPGEAVEEGPGLGAALGLMSIGALVASFWWAVVIWLVVGR